MKAFTGFQRGMGFGGWLTKRSRERVIMVGGMLTIHRRGGTATTGEDADGEAHNNMQPYVTCYMFFRQGLTHI